MDRSAMSAVDMILERHRSSLVPASPTTTSVAATVGTTGEAISSSPHGTDASPRSPQQPEQTVSIPATRQVPRPTSPLEESALPRWSSAVAGGLGSGFGRVGASIPPQAQSPSPMFTLPRDSQPQPETIRHEVTDLCDTLQFRLRANDRDLQSILSRSTDRLERLSLSDQDSPTAQSTSTPPEVHGGQESEEALRMMPTPPPQHQYEAMQTDETVKEPVPTAPEGVPNPGSIVTSTKSSTETSMESHEQRLTPPSTGVGAAVSSASSTADMASLSDTPSVNFLSPPLDPQSEAGQPSSDSSKTSPPPTTAMPAPVARIKGRKTPDYGGSAVPAGLAATGPASGGVGALPGISDTAVSTPQRSTGGEAGRTGSGLNGVDGGGGMGSRRDLRCLLGQGSVLGSSGGDTGGATTGTPPRLPRSLADGMIVEAATEAARWLAVDDRTWHQSKKFLDDCMADCPNEKTLKRRGITREEWWDNKVASIKATISADPSLARCRSINRSALPMDGWTPLHLAAARGNLRFVQALLESPSVSAFSVDLQGRTALALAAEGGHEDLVKLLKARMEAESADSIVGINAPVDLAGRTPLAWSVRSRARNKQVEPHLYAAGDASVCPATPAALRSGGGRSAGSGMGAGRASAERGGGGLPCGYADVPGWRIEMEDAVCIHNPIRIIPGEARKGPPLEPVSMFGVFDGHGGTFTSKYVSEKFVKCLQDTSGWKSGNREINCLCPAVLEAFVSCDQQLSQEPRMVITEIPKPQSGKRFEAHDASGSTAVVAVVTPAHVIVANAGDSRAVLVMAPCSSTTASTTPAGTGNASILANEGTSIAQPGGCRSGPELSQTPPQGSSDGIEAMEDYESPAGDDAALNDSVRLEEDDDEDDEGVDAETPPEGRHEEIAGGGMNLDSSIRDLLGTLMGGGSDNLDSAREAGESALSALMGINDGDREGLVAGSSAQGADRRGKHVPKQVEVQALSRDHTAADEAEKERVEAAGGRTFAVNYTDEDGASITVVRTAYDSKVEGQSVVPSRGFGDFYYKQKRGRDGHLLPPEKQVVTTCPEIMVHERGSSRNEELLLLACDGVWDVFDDEAAGEFLISQLEGPASQVTGEDLARACDALVQACLQRGSTDNITAMAISLGSGPPPPPSAVGGRVLFAGDGL